MMQMTLSSKLSALGLILGLLAGGPMPRAFAQSPKPPKASRITNVSGSRLTIDGGSNNGYKRGMVLDVYSSAKVVNLPLSGKKEPIYIQQKVISRLVITSVSSSSSTAEYFAGASKNAVSGQVVLFNPTLAVKNQKPIFKGLSPKTSKTRPSSHNWRDRVVLNFEIDNEAEDDIYFKWKSELIAAASSGTDNVLETGVVLAPRTKLPENTWLCPATKGTYRVTVQAIDSKGFRNSAVFYLQSQGVVKKVKHLVKYRGIACDEAAVAGVRDLAVDIDGSLVLLVGSSGSFLGSDSISIKIQSESGEFTGSYKLKGDHGGATRLVVTDQAAFLLDPKNYKVKRFDRGRTKNIGAAMTTKPRSFGVRGVGNGKFSKPVDLAVLASGDIAVLDQANAAIQVFSEQGIFLYSVGMQGGGKGQMKLPVALASSPKGYLYCLDSGRRVILEFRNGKFFKEFSVAAQGQVTGMALDPFNNVIGVTDSGGRTLVRVNPELGKMISNSIGGPFQPALKSLLELRQCSVVRHDGHSRFIVVDRERRSLVKFSSLNSKKPGPNGFVGRIGGIELGDGLKVAAAGNGDLGILNPSSKLIFRLDRQGWMNLIVGGDNTKGFRFRSPIDIAFDNDGNCYVLDAGISRVFPIDKTGKVKPAIGVAGEGPSQLMDCIDMECSGKRRALLILQERKNNNFHNLDFNGVGQSMSRNDSIDDPDVACVDIFGKFWAIDDDTLGTKAPGRPFKQESTEFDEVTDMAASIDGTVYIVDYGDYFIGVFETKRGNGLAGRLGDIKIKAISKPKDIGLDNYGRIYVYDDSSEKVHILSD